MEFSDFMGMGREITSLAKGVTEVVKSIKDLNSGGKPESKKLIDSAAETLRDKVLELQEKQFEFQQAAVALTQENVDLVKTNHALEMELAKLKQFDADRSKFDRIALAFNTFAYRERGLDGPAESQPLLCPNCFDNSKKTYLSFKEHVAHANAMLCSACGSMVHVPRDESGSIQAVRINRSLRGWDDGWL